MNALPKGTGDFADTIRGIQDRRDAAVEAEYERIFADRNLLIDAVSTGSRDDDDSMSLAELRVVMRNASTLLDQLCHGDDFDMLLRTHAIAFRELLRAAKSSDEIVTDRVRAAAEEVVS